MQVERKPGAREPTRGVIEERIEPQRGGKERAAEADLNQAANEGKEKDVRMGDEIRVERAGMGAVRGVRGRCRPISNAYIAMVTIM